MRGTTPELTFNMPFDTSDIKKLYVTFKNRANETVLEKTETDCTFSGNKITLELSQEETLLFEERTQIRAQLRWLTQADKAEKSKVFIIYSDELLKDGVI